MRILVLGGARSGKSEFAESLLAAATEVDYLATAARDPDDAEWAARIAAHRARRPATWRTVESADLDGALAGAGPALLVDSITAWLTRTMDACGSWAAPTAHHRRVDELCARWGGATRTVVAVSDEVGLGVVPDTPAGRLFRDELGSLNQRLARAADEVHLVVAGLPLRLR